MKNKGLSLSEVIMVVLVITLLLSTIMPALGLANKQAQSIRCKNNLKKLAFALIVYCQTNDVKSVVGLGGTEHWFVQMAPYLGDTQLKYNKEYLIELFDQNIDVEQELPLTIEALRCPAVFKEPTSKPFKGNFSGGSIGSARRPYRYHGVNVPGTYTINDWAGGWIGSGYANGIERRRSYRDTGPIDPEVPLFADAVWVGALPKDTDLTPGYWSHGYNLNTGNVNSGIGRLCTYRHGRYTNIVYWEGHARTILLGELWNQQWHKEFDKRIIANPLDGSVPNNHY